MMIVWNNGQFIKKEDLTISPYDHGFLYGLGFFETFRTYNGKPFLWELHMKRLQDALAEFRIQMPYTSDELIQIVAQLNDKNDGGDGYFRLNVTAGVHDIGLQPTHYDNPNVIVFRKPLPPTVRGAQKRATVVNVTRNSPESTIRHKSHHYANNVLARLQVPSLVDVEGIMLTSEGYVSEGITSNIFWVKDDVLYTSSIETGILPGIIREWLVQQFPVQVGRFTLQHLLSADEVFVTNSVQELVPINEIDGTDFKGNKGEWYNKLHSLYVSQVEEECGN